MRRSEDETGQSGYADLMCRRRQDQLLELFNLMAIDDNRMRGESKLLHHDY